ncbi:FAD-dependent oxidoreductase [Actinoplanes sp. NPDC048796]|uniref:FAD-dependent oxidoreductase n=1 Tax=unclassified Actinoplanes TaxID=2626549 RepID=UPI0033DBC0D6
MGSDQLDDVADAITDLLPLPRDADPTRPRPLDEMGIRLVLGSPLRALPKAAPGELTAVEVTTEAGETVTADIWFRAFGVRPATDYAHGALADARDARGYLAVDEQLQVKGLDGVFALGDISDADRDTAGAASQQAEVVAADTRAAITGEGKPQTYDPGPTVIVVPLGPQGGASQLPGGVTGSAATTSLKGASMLVEKYSARFDASER